jgi:hypothetical protein
VIEGLGSIPSTKKKVTYQTQNEDSKLDRVARLWKAISSHLRTTLSPQTFLPL